ncbi:hypothetical protein SAMN05421803_105164 [Nocardiopsis flavescens]|uniref:Flagellar hook-length control protein FliK n=1 Tax=Nocardiopsis flavescens TaxID=758803 RepID=A0A1M6IHP7_9ACTN|nr:ABC transporter substrate-binding protein [Nocardiopsis flavescens]SHJ33949.1 hypothetical protein SAMN05421803_105164 [Nocardiopsis flavescens]
MTLRIPRPVSRLRRVLHTAAAALLLAGVTGGAVVAEPGPVLAVDHGRGLPGHCPDGNGVTVVVDFQELGGDTIVRCAVGDQETGHSALKNAGIEITGTNRWGEAFICRIEGRPGPESEPCIDTPPASAYWSYWHAPNGGAWTYSQWGAMNRKPPLGSFEGWSFSLNRTEDTNPPPRTDPLRPENGGGDGGSGASGGSGGTGGSAGGEGGGAPGGSTGGSDRGGSEQAGSGPGTDTDSGTGAQDGARPPQARSDGDDPAVTAAGPDSGPGVEPSRFDEPVPGPDDLPSEVSGWDGGEDGAALVSSTADVDGLPWGTLLGGGAAALLATVGLATAWQRRRERGAHAE